MPRPLPPEKYRCTNCLGTGLTSCPHCGASDRECATCGGVGITFDKLDWGKWHKAYAPLMETHLRNAPHIVAGVEVGRVFPDDTVLLYEDFERGKP